MNKYKIIDVIITLLDEIEVDGEQMEFILNEVGMNDQMLRQLIMSNPYTDTTDILPIPSDLYKALSQEK